MTPGKLAGTIHSLTTIAFLGLDPRTTRHVHRAESDPRIKPEGDAAGAPDHRPSSAQCHSGAGRNPCPWPSTYIQRREAFSMDSGLRRNDPVVDINTGCPKKFGPFIPLARARKLPSESLYI
ncbi:hypothetical protein GCM10007913_38010 [Devosia yakushimensis]|uniref:Uncharacterized protein n=1 Tax=Devosia yakushimensis TaxID=470028 RepID=A0ABQ5UIF9_9HYPH|nr:hypothetical protein GCM10007913_38010 [Devosia yakushimensis]